MMKEPALQLFASCFISNKLPCFVCYALMLDKQPHDVLLLMDTKLRSTCLRGDLRLSVHLKLDLQNVQPFPGADASFQGRAVA